MGKRKSYAQLTALPRALTVFWRSSHIGRSMLVKAGEPPYGRKDGCDNVPTPTLASVDFVQLV